MSYSNAKWRTMPKRRRTMGTASMLALTLADNKYLAALDRVMLLPKNASASMQQAAADDVALCRANLNKVRRSLGLSERE
jgi:hypothetical protein